MIATKLLEKLSSTETIVVKVFQTWRMSAEIEVEIPYGLVNSDEVFKKVVDKANQTNMSDYDFEEDPDTTAIETMQGFPLEDLELTFSF